MISSSNFFRLREPSRVRSIENVRCGAVSFINVEPDFQYWG
jgi:hypothetical protein